MYNVYTNICIYIFYNPRQPLKDMQQPRQQAVEEPDSGDTKPLTEEERRQKVSLCVLYVYIVHL